MNVPSWTFGRSDITIEITTADGYHDQESAKSAAPEHDGCQTRTETCPGGSVIDAGATCPQPPDQQQQQQPPSVDCNASPNDPSCTPPPSGN